MKRLHNLEKILGTLEEAQRSMILEQMEHRAGEAPVWMRIHLPNGKVSKDAGLCLGAAANSAGCRLE